MNILKPIREIRSKSGELHFRRWRVIETPWFNIYVHYIAKSDADRHSHSHPWNFITLILKGGYVTRITKYVADAAHFRMLPVSKYLHCKMGSVHRLEYTQFHKIKLVKPTWTLVFTGKRLNENWGYLLSEQNVCLTNDNYRKLKQETKK